MTSMIFRGTRTGSQRSLPLRSPQEVNIASVSCETGWHFNARRMIVVGQCAATHGAVRHHLGLLCAALGESKAATHYLDEATEIYERARAPLWRARTQYARALL